MQLNKNNFIGSIEILFTGIIWGFIGFFVKELSMMGATSEIITFFRVFFAFVFAVIVALIMYGPKSFILTREQLMWCFLDGVLTQGIFNYCYSICVEKSGVAIAAVLLYTSPVFNAIISYLVFKEKLGFKRNFTAEEIVNQIFLIQADTGLKITNIVYMGQGEPLLNFDNLIKSIKIFKEQFQIGARRITVSTCGIIPAIDKLAALDFQSTLAVSLHAPNQKVRASIMPIAEKYDYNSLIETLKSYTQKTGRRVTIEYVLLGGVNDSVNDAYETAKNIAKLKCNVNLIVYNCHEKSRYKKPDKSAVQKFKYILEASGKKVTVRLERGADIAAACGQLSSKKLNKAVIE